MDEKPICVVTIISMAGAHSRIQMDEKSMKMGTYANGASMWGYQIATSGEGIDHVRVSPVGQKPQWIRCWEKDHTRPLVSISYIVEPSSELAVSITALAEQIREFNVIFRNKVF